MALTEKVNLRRASPEDRPAILNISAQIWEGNDYIPRVLDLWLEDEEGELTVLTLDGRVTGFSHLSILSPGHGWLEGARIEPGLQGRGLGRALTEYHIGLARKLGLKTLRYSTATDNLASLALASGLGFSQLGIWHRYNAPPDIEASRPELWLEEVPGPKDGLLALGWKVIPWQTDLVAKWQQGGQIWRNGEAGMILVPDKRPERLLIPLLWGPAEDLAPLLAFARHPREGVEKIVWVGTGDLSDGMMQRAGFTRDKIDMAILDFSLKEV